MFKSPRGGGLFCQKTNADGEKELGQGWDEDLNPGGNGPRFLSHMQNFTV